MNDEASLARNTAGPAISSGLAHRFIADDSTVAGGFSDGTIRIFDIAAQDRKRRTVLLPQR